MYDIDRCRSKQHVIIQEQKAPAARGKRSKVHPTPAPESPVFTLPLRVLEAHAIKLAHRDVTTNLKADNCCEDCGLSQYLPNGEIDGNLRGCDMGYPYLIGYTFPAGGNGGQHQCHRGSICNTCINNRPSERTAGWSLRHKGVVVPEKGFLQLRREGVPDSQIYFLCSECTKGTSDRRDAWSDGSEEANIHLRPGCLHPTSSPVGAPADEAPYADRHVAAQAAAEKRLASGGLRFMRYGGVAVVKAAAAFTRVARSLFMPARQQGAVLTLINDLHEAGVLRAGDAAMGVCPLPRDIRTLVTRAEHGLRSPDDVEFRKITLGLHELQQQQQECHVLVNNLEACIQSILNDPRFPHKERYFRSPLERATYTDQDGNIAHGPELWHGQQWQNLEDTIDPAIPLLFLIMHSDETVSLRGSRYPFRLQIGNFSSNGRNKDNGSRLVGLGPLINIHRQRGSKAHVNLSESQKACKHSVETVTPAYMLADLNEVSKLISTFELWCPGPRGKQRIRVVLRLGYWCADFEEKKALAGIRGEACPRCHGYQHSVQKETAAGRVPRSITRKQFDRGTALPYMCHTPRSICEGAEPRTEASVIKIQVHGLRPPCTLNGL